MLWLLFALIGALFRSLADLLSKRLLQDKDEYIVMWSRPAFAALILLLILLFTEIPKTDTTFWLVVLIGAPINVIALLLYMRAIKISPLSLTIPMLGTSAIYILLVSYVLLGELPSFIGLIGIITIVFGAYILGMDSNKKEFLAPFKSLVKEKGPVLMLVVAFIFSITATIGKVGMLHSNVVFFTFTYVTIMAIIFSIIIFCKSRKNFYQIKRNFFKFFLIGVLMVADFFFILFAFKYALVNYVISAKRASILFSTIFGFMFFKEKNIKERLLGAVIIIIGIIIISLA